MKKYRKRYKRVIGYGASGAGPVTQIHITKGPWLVVAKFPVAPPPLRTPSIKDAETMADALLEILNKRTQR